jgi:hypothetical protein
MACLDNGDILIVNGGQNGCSQLLYNDLYDLGLAPFLQ